MRNVHLTGTVALACLLGTAAAPAGAGILDVVPGAEAAYSLRQLTSTYTGPAIQVRVGTDTQDIGFVNGQLDTGSLLSFAGSGTAFVTTWYDQTGNGQHVTRTSGTYPQIVSSGQLVVNPVTDLPAIRFLNTSLERLHDAGNPWNPWSETLSVLTAASWVGVPTNANSLAQRLWTMRVGDSSRAGAGGENSLFALLHPNTAGDNWAMKSSNATIIAGEPFVLSYLSDATKPGSQDEVFMYLNGETIYSSTSLNIGAATPNHFTVGAHTGATRPFNGIMHELILYHSVLSPQDRALVEHSLMRYVPEPGSMLLLLAGGMAVLVRRRRMRSTAQ
ncbi:MAG: PEP-CTERM sorting domain-containing protein [Thermoguttaceae bacterium]|jgi:hypothetical protein|nr:PEP-CTERM sorting domain-containing protein [Thermoguttaceae bacterium]